MSRGASPIDRTGQRYGSLVALEIAGRTSAGNVKWRCRCDCGNEALTVGTELARSVTSCGRDSCHPRLGTKAERSPVWTGRRVSYAGAHARVRRQRGSASSHPCVGCEFMADQWAYDNSDPNELTDDKGRRYSSDPNHYVPMCRPCHVLADVSRRRGVTLSA